MNNRWQQQILFPVMMLCGLLHGTAAVAGCDVPVFTDAISLGTDSPPASYAVAVGDLNADGKPDLVIANPGSFLTNFSDAGVWVLLGNGDGTFKPPAKYRAGNPSSVSIGDFNGDGKPDLVVTSPSSQGGGCGAGSFSVLLAKGDGTFQASVTHALEASPRAVTVGDVNADGKADLVMACDCSARNLLLLLGNGDGTFQPSVTFTSGAPSTAVAMADLNGDGRPDLVTANIGGSVSVWLGNGNGIFRPATNSAAGIGPRSLVAADFNRDGKIDLAVADFGSSANGNTDGGVLVLLGNGDGTFQPPANFGPGIAARSVALADVNGDGRADLAVADSIDGTVSVFLGKGDATFQPGASFYVGSSTPVSLVSGDFNVDRSPDFAVAVTESQPASGYLSGYVSLLLNTCVSPLPILSVISTNEVAVIAWPYPSTGFLLESTPSLALPIWQPVPEPMVTNDSQLEVMIPVASAHERYFRLHKP